VIEYNKSPDQIIDSSGTKISTFDNGEVNIDHSVVESFGEEWTKFNSFSDSELKLLEGEYFDIVSEEILNKDSYCLDAGCGTGRYTKVLVNRAKFFEAVDPSDAILVASRMLKEQDNVRLTKASIANLPFDDEVFDFVMSIGVLHHIPDTKMAMRDCVSKLKKGGYFYVYLYYALDNRSFLFRLFYYLSVPIRLITSSLPSTLKKAVCYLWAIILYMPFILLGRLLAMVGLRKLAMALPLSSYQDKSFKIINNDALDRFGTSLEQRFTKSEIKKMLVDCGLVDIVFSEKSPYWHAIGKKK